MENCRIFNISVYISWIHCIPWPRITSQITNKTISTSAYIMFRTFPGSFTTAPGWKHFHLHTHISVITQWYRTLADIYASDMPTYITVDSNTLSIVNLDCDNVLLTTSILLFLLVSIFVFIEYSDHDWRTIYIVSASDNSTVYSV